MRSQNQAPGPPVFDPCDYVELQNGDYLYVQSGFCVRWPTGLVTYLGNDVSKPQSGIRKLLTAGTRSIHDQYIRSNWRTHTVDDPLAGWMVAPTQECIRNVLSGRNCFARLFDAQREVRQIATYLGVIPGEVGVTGSTLIHSTMKSDFDIVVYDQTLGHTVAARIRDMIQRYQSCRVPGRWGSSHHHRRFRIGRLVVCPRFPLPQMALAPFRDIIGVSLVSDLRLKIVNNYWGHCVPSLYTVEVLHNSNTCESADTHYLLSFDIRHSMAFRVGDTITVSSARRTTSTTGTVVFTLQFGESDAIKPIQ